MRLKLQRLSPWRLKGLSAVGRLILAWGLLEGVRNGFYAGYLAIHGGNLGFTLAVIGTAWSIHLLSDSFSKSLGGFLSQKLGMGIVTLAAGSVGLVALLIVPQASSPLLLFALSLVWGVSLSAIFPGLLTLSSQVAVQGREGRAVTLTNMLTAPWTGIGVLGIGFLTKVNPNLALSVLEWIQVTVILIGLSLIFRPERVRPPRQELYPWRRLLLFIPAAFGQTFAPALFSFYILKYAQSLGLSIFWITVLIVLGGGLSMVLLIWTGRYADRKSPRELLIVGLLLIGLAMMGLGLKPELPALLLLAVVGGVGFGCFGPAWNALVVRLLPENNRAAAWGTLMTVEGLGHAIGPAVGGVLAAAIANNAPFFAGGTIMLLLSIFYVFALWRPWWTPQP
ncbi:MAG: MFS transporter [Meiothermus sp.]|uniref:MFS transporter n=1 Tax=Meiothermus sp. TaxID=1955249 RepID=UPI0025CCB0FF|nr:MFS transporter [Meiothermus sp.]MCS7067616.1 MFS transporter [Meiothermus sp.]MCX7601055.1 MFS transporter [Meiothermus sp.]MDW8424355.1 MFS transporter [Meiothermus sp.]